MEEGREEASHSTFPGQEERKWILKTLEERDKRGENHFSGSHLPLTLLSQVRPHTTAVLFSLLISQSIPKGRKEASQASSSPPSPQTSYIPFRPPPLHPPIFPRAAFPPHRPGISSPCAVSGPDGNFCHRVKTRDLRQPVVSRPGL